MKKMNQYEKERSTMLQKELDEFREMQAKFFQQCVTSFSTKAKSTMVLLANVAFSAITTFSTYRILKMTKSLRRKPLGLLACLGFNFLRQLRIHFK
jgi:hypothetical protein